MGVGGIDFDQGLQQIPRQLLVGGGRQRCGAPSAGDLE
jgi:hypothetical protein